MTGEEGGGRGRKGDEGEGKGRMGEERCVKMYFVGLLGLLTLGQRGVEGVKVIGLPSCESHVIQP